MISSASIIIRKPYGQEPATLGIRAAWAMLTNGGIDIKIILMGEGVYAVLGKTGYIKTMFERFIGEEGEVYAVKEDLEERGISTSDLLDGIEVVERSAVAGLIEDTESVVTF